MGLSIVVSPSSTDLFEASTMLSEDENLTYYATTVEAVLSGKQRTIRSKKQSISAILFVF
jgi:hypothetical protein